MEPSRPKTVGIKEIAKALGISIGTVDRALHNRKRVDAKTKAMVLKMAEQLQYRPNLAARSLKLNRRLRIAAYLPTEIASFFDELRAGIRDAASSLTGLKLDLDFRTFPRLGEGDAQLVEQALEERYDGILITPGDPATLEPIMRRIAASGTAVICVASDAPRSGRLTAVCVDAVASGGIAAELLGKTIHRESFVATITGNRSTYDHSEKLCGFAAGLASLAPHLTLLPTIETHERPEEAYRASLDLLNRNPRLSGLYVSTANSIPVLKALKEKELIGKIAVITTDLFPELATLLDSGGVLATLYQRPFAQGRFALETLVRYLVDGSRPQPLIHLAPHIILRSNLHLFNSQVVGNLGREVDEPIFDQHDRR